MSSSGTPVIFRRAGDGVFGDVVQALLVASLVGGAIGARMGAQDGRLLLGAQRLDGAVGLIEHGRSIDDDGLAGHGVDAALNRLNAKCAHAQEGAIVFHQEGSLGVGTHVVRVFQLVGGDVVHQAQHKRAVGARANGNIRVGMGSRGAELRIDGDQRNALLLGIAHVVPDVHVRLIGAPSPGDHGLGVHHVVGGVAVLAEAQHLHVHLGVVPSMPPAPCSRQR